MKLGKYRHYKGNLYEVIAVAKHSETLEDYVVYKALYKTKTEYWIRPLKMFNEKIIVDNKLIPRFKFIKNN
jgi:cyclomaltodextrinase / maltogenic alpha-amylase / neopullulanase